VTDRSVLVRLRADISQFQRSMVSAGASAKSFAKDLDQADSRMANLLQTGLALGPALVPIAAAGVPAIAGLTLQLGLAAAAGGTALLAFNGVGDGLKALNAYQLEPTAKNFAKLNDALDKLGPAGQEFVLSLDKMTPKFHELQALAEQGLLPGVTEGLNELMDLMPQAREMVGTFSSTLGTLAAEAGDNLNDPRWVDFFDYIDQTAGPVLLEMGRTFGNLTEGIATTLKAFDPLSRDFSTGFLDMSRSFNDWSQGLDDSQGFQDFVDYVQTNGPKAMDALGSLAGALIELVEAAAPVGSALLPVISGLADGLAAIADSPVGPVLISTAAAIGVLGRSMAVLKAVGIAPGENGKTGIIGRALGTDEVKKSLPTLGQVGTVFARAGQSAEYASQKTLGARAAVREFTSSMKPAAGLVGGMALATSGLAEKTGLANTASLGLMGTIAGPWGAALGAGVGVVMDLAASNDDLEAAIRAVDQAASNPSGLVAQQKALEALQAKTRDTQDLMSSAASGDQISFFDPSTYHNFGKQLSGELAIVGDKFSDTGDKAATAGQKQAASLLTTRAGVAALYASLNGGDTRLVTAPLAEVEAYAQKVTPALSQVGLSVTDLFGHFEQGRDAVVTYTEAMDSADGKSAAVGAALADLSGEMESNVTQADALKASLDALFGVELNQSQATDAATVALKEMRKAVAAAGKDLLGNGDAALKARDGIRGYVSAQLDKVQADAAATGNGKQAAETLLKTRDNLIATAHAAGLGEKAIARLTAEMGLTPKNLTTIVTQPDILNAKEQARALGRLYNLTPKQLQTFVTQPGMTRSKADIAALAAKYGMTPREVRTLIKALDNATPVIGRVRLGIAGIQSKTVTLTTVHRDVRVGGGTGVAANPTLNADGGLHVNGVRQFADGGLGADGRYYSRQPQIVAGGANILWGEKATGWEAYISGKPGQQDRNLDVWRQAGERLGARFVEYADGGLRTHASSGGNTTPKKPETPSETKARLEKEKNERERARKAAEARREHIKSSLYSFDLTGDMGIDSLRSAFHSLRDDFKLGDKAFMGLQKRAEHVTRAYERQAKKVDETTNKRDQLRSDKASLASGVTSAFTHDATGNGVAGLVLQLQADKADATTALGLSKSLDGKGIDQGLQSMLLDKGDLNTLSQLAMLSKPELANVSNLYKGTTAATGALGAYAGRDAFDKQIQEQSTLMKTQTQTLKNLDKRMEGLEAAVERGARAGVGDRDKRVTAGRRAGR
jgi:hypothetical protein